MGPCSGAAWIGPKAFHHLRSTHYGFCIFETLNLSPVNPCERDGGSEKVQPTLRQCEWLRESCVSALPLPAGAFRSRGWKLAEGPRLPRLERLATHIIDIDQHVLNTTHARDLEADQVMRTWDQERPVPRLRLLLIRIAGLCFGLDERSRAWIYRIWWPAT